MKTDNPTLNKLAEIEREDLNCLDCKIPCPVCGNYARDFIVLETERGYEIKHDAACEKTLIMISRN